LGYLAKSFRTLAALTVATIVSISPVGLLAGSSNAGAANVPTCSSKVLSLSLGFSQAAAGNVGTPIVITNNGVTMCSIAGYPIVVAHTEAISPHPVTFVDRPRSQIYVVASVRTVDVAPRGTASFGISYGDAYDQQDGEGRDCFMSSITVQFREVAPARRITVHFTKGEDGFGGPINSCFAGFEFGLTPVVKGSTPPEH
jgi:hypothetical protein